MQGEFVPVADAALSVHANAVSYGTGTFEGMRGTWNDQAQELYLLEPLAHYERLERSANALALPLPHTADELVEITVELLRRNEARSDVYIRPLLLLPARSCRCGCTTSPRASRSRSHRSRRGTSTPPASAALSARGGARPARRVMASANWFIALRPHQGCRRASH